MTRWEYRVLERLAPQEGAKWQVLDPFAGGYKVEREDNFFPALLALLGSDGWELVGVAIEEPRAAPTFYFKRPR